MDASLNGPRTSPGNSPKYRNISPLSRSVATTTSTEPFVHSGRIHHVIPPARPTRRPLAPPAISPRLCGGLLPHPLPTPASFSLPRQPPPPPQRRPSPYPGVLTHRECPTLANLVALSSTPTRSKQATDPPLPWPAVPSPDPAASSLPRLTAGMAGVRAHTPSSEPTPPQLPTR